MSEAWPNSLEASKSVAFTSSTVAPVERKGGMKRVDGGRRRRKKKFTTRRSREKRETRSERQLVGKKYVKSSKEERLTQGDKLQRQTEI